MTKDAGLDNALKMREMYNSDPSNTHVRARLDAQSEPFYSVTVDLCPWNGFYFEYSVATFRFNQDGTYVKYSHQ